MFLEAHNPGCRVARCGNCFYDLEFAVQGAPEGGEINVAVAETDGAAKVCQPGFELKGVTLLGPSGVRCSPLEPGLFMPPPPECERYAACSDSCTCTSGTRCAPRTRLIRAGLPRHGDAGSGGAR